MEPPCNSIDNTRRRSPLFRRIKSPKSPKSPHLAPDSRSKLDVNGTMECFKRWGNSYCRSPLIKSRLNTHGLFFKPTRSCSQFETKGSGNVHHPTVKDLLEGVKDTAIIATVKESDNLASIVESLSTWRKSITTVQDSNGRLVGIIDIMDLVEACYQRVKSSTNVECAAIECREEFQNKTAASFLAEGGGSRVISLSHDASIFDLIKLLRSPNINNVAILKDNVKMASSHEDLLAILTHTDVMNYAIGRPGFFSQLGLSASNFVSRTQEKIEKEKAENKVKDDFLVASSFKTIWHKQTSGGVMCHGLHFLDKFLNWLVQIILADLPVEDTSLESSKTLNDVIKLMVNSSVSRVLITNDEGETLGFCEVHDIMDKLSEQQGLQRNI